MQNTGTEPSQKAKSLLLASAQPVTEWTDFDKRAGTSDSGVLKHSNACCWLWLGTDILSLHVSVASAIKMQSLIRGHLVRAVRRRAQEGQGDKGSNGLNSDSLLSEVLSLVH